MFLNTPSPSEEVERVSLVFLDLLNRATRNEEIEGGFYRGLAREPLASDPHETFVSVKHRVYVDPNTEEVGVQSRTEQPITPYWRVPVISYRMYDTDLATAYLEETGWKIDISYGNDYTRTTKVAVNTILFHLQAEAGIVSRDREPYLVSTVRNLMLPWLPNDIMTFSWITGPGGNHARLF